MHYFTRISACVCLIACATFAFQSCDDNVTCPTNHTPTPSGAQVTVSPDTATLQLGEHRSFAALYKGEPAEFLWRVTSGPGEILASGEYIAPSELAVYSMTATIKAVLATDTNQFGYAKVIVIGSNTGGGGNGGGQPIDTTVCFERDILPILRSSCAMSGCHDSKTREEGIDLTSYVSMQNSKKRLVVAHDVQGSKLYKAITEDEGDDDRMPPPPRPRLTDDQIALIRRWILEGATNRDCSQDTAGTGCDVSNVTYAKTIQPILQNNCLGCHSGSAPTAGISLVGYANVKKLANDGRLVGVTSHAQGYVAMPPGGILQNCAIEQIKKWVENGAPNN